MAHLVIRCPRTGKPVFTGIGGDRRSLQSGTYTNNYVSCPHCKGTHVWSNANVFIQD